MLAGMNDVRTRRPVRVPTQARAKETVERILAAADEHLVTEGLSGFTTNAIADRAGVNIATLYAYYPDKAAVLRELILRADNERLEVLETVIEGISGDSWRDAVCEGVDTMVRFRSANPGVSALRRAALGTTDLRALDKESNRRVAAAMADRLRQRNPALKPREADRVCQVAVESSIAVLDDACDGGRVDRRKVGELKAMLTGYLAPHLDT